MIYKFEINLRVFGESSKYTKMGRACTVLAVLHKQKHVWVSTATNKFYTFYDMKSQINEFIFPWFHWCQELADFSKLQYAAQVRTIDEIIP